MKNVLILTSKKIIGSNATQLSEDVFEAELNTALGRDIEVKVAALHELIFQAGSTMRIWHPTERYDIAEFDAVIIRKVGQYRELGIAAAHYLKSKNVPFTDSYLLSNGNGKLACAFIRTIANISVPDTIFGPAKDVLNENIISFPCIVKADLGRAGQDNFLVQNAEEYQSIQKDYKDTIMVTQNYISNTGDFRVLIFGGKPHLAILRQSKGDTHLNNTSQGGTAKLIDIKNLSPVLIEEAIKATALENLEVAGVDVIIDEITGEHVILEVNRAPQIPTGTFLNEKITHYADFIKGIVASKPYADSRVVIGRAETIKFPEIVTKKIKARVDTGAKTSSIWASSELQDDGRLAVKLFGTDSELYDGKTHYFKEFDDTIVASSNGHYQHRYKVRLLVVLGGKRIRAWFTLADRSTQVYPVLIGRNVLLRKFVVDVNEGKPDYKAERERSRNLQAKKGHR